MMKNRTGTNHVQQAREAGFKIEKLAIHGEREPINPAHNALGTCQLIDVESPFVKIHFNLRAGRQGLEVTQSLIRGAKGVGREGGKQCSRFCVKLGGSLDVAVIDCSYPNF